jgi:hypothetical protein
MVQSIELPLGEQEVPFVASHEAPDGQTGQKV